MRNLHRVPTPALVAASALALTLAVMALVLALSSSGRGQSSGEGPSSAGSASASQQFDGAPLPGEPRAPGFTLTDEHGRAVSLGEYRGRVVVLAFLYTTCGAPCVLVAEQVRGALDELQAEHARAPAVLIVSADPATDTRARAERFLAEVSLSGRAEYLTGPLARLRRVWSAYGVRPASAGRAAFAEYASVLLVDARGRERVLFGSEELTPEGIAHDVARLQAG